MKKSKWISILVIAILYILGSAVCHTYGPYKGKLVDSETGQPIEGAAVFFEFYTEGIYAVGKYADAIEKITDKDGEFKIDEHLVVVFPRLFNEWVDNGIVIIFKPGFGAYQSGTAEFELNKSNTDDNFSVIKLKKLKTIQERSWNWAANLDVSIDVPRRKYKKLLELKKTEYENISK